MSELSFLVDLLLNHKLPKATRDAIATRIKDVESSYSVRSPTPAMARQVVPAGLEGQAPSTIAAMMRHGSNTAVTVMPLTIGSQPQEDAAIPVTTIAQTPAAVAAINSRQQAINEALSGKVDKVSGRPRKF